MKQTGGQQRLRVRGGCRAAGAARWRWSAPRAPYQPQAPQQGPPPVAAAAPVPVQPLQLRQARGGGQHPDPAQAGSRSRLWKQPAATPPAWAPQLWGRARPARARGHRCAAEALDAPPLAAAAVAAAPAAAAALALIATCQMCLLRHQRQNRCCGRRLRLALPAQSATWDLPRCRHHWRGRCQCQCRWSARPATLQHKNEVQLMELRDEISSYRSTACTSAAGIILPMQQGMSRLTRRHCLSPGCSCSAQLMQAAFLWMICICTCRAADIKGADWRAALGGQLLGALLLPGGVRPQRHLHRRRQQRRQDLLDVCEPKSASSVPCPRSNAHLHVPDNTANVRQRLTATSHPRLAVSAHTTSKAGTKWVRVCLQTALGF